MDLDKVRGIKFSRDALYEFIYEMLNERVEHYFDLDRQRFPLILISTGKRDSSSIA